MMGRAAGPGPAFWVHRLASWGRAVMVVRMRRRMRRGANSVTNAVPDRQHAADADTGGSKNDPKPGKKADAPCF